MSATDKKIQQRIVNQLHQDTQVDADHIDVNVDHRTVTLTGEVPTDDDLIIVRTLAWGTEGVEDVLNLLAVHPTVCVDPARDRDLAIKIKDRLDRSRSLDAGGITPRVVGGVVTLEGTVAAYWEKESAETKVAGIGGVVKVVNKLAVVPEPNESDAEVARQVVLVLDREPVVDARKITVEVRNGFVTLTGTVPGWTSHRMAENAAAFTSGVTGIHNQLTVPL